MLEGRNEYIDSAYKHLQVISQDKKKDVNTRKEKKLYGIIISFCGKLLSAESRLASSAARNVR